MLEGLKKSLNTYRGNHRLTTHVHTCDLNTQLGWASLRFGDLSAVQARFWIQYHWKKEGVTHLIPEFSAAEGPRLE